MELGVDRDSGRQLIGLNRAQDVDRLVGKLLRFWRIERDDLVIELLGVLVHRREQRDLELHVGHVQLALGEVDRLRVPEPTLDQVGPGALVQRLVLEQRRPDDADVGPGDKHAVDVTAETSAGDAEAELPAIACPGAEVEPGGLQPANGQILELVTGVENAKQPAVEFPAVIYRRERKLVGEPAGARLADPAAAEVVARRLRPVLGFQRRIDKRVDTNAGIAHCARCAVDEARPGIQVDQHQPEAFDTRGWRPW
jgi:hypothetical protein